MKETQVPTFYPESAKDWRKWLKKNHAKEQSVWLICYKKKTEIPSIVHSDAVDEALCFGWIDSTRKSIGDDRFMQFFTRRKPQSVWSKINKAKVERLIAEGRMEKAGYASIELAKQNGSWTILDDVEDLKVPADLTAALKSKPGAKSFFKGLSRSRQKMLLQWLVLAKRDETRMKRIGEIAEMAGQGLVPKQFR